MLVPNSSRLSSTRFLGEVVMVGSAHFQMSLQSIPSTESLRAVRAWESFVWVSRC